MELLISVVLSLLSGLRGVTVAHLLASQRTSIPSGGTEIGF